jgi:hypothetical protein
MQRNLVLQQDPRVHRRGANTGKAGTATKKNAARLIRKKEFVAAKLPGDEANVTTSPGRDHPASLVSLTVPREL